MIEVNRQLTSPISDVDERDIWQILTLLASLDGASIPAAELDEINWRVARLKGRVQ